MKKNNFKDVGWRRQWQGVWVDEAADIRTLKPGEAPIDESADETNLYAGVDCQALTTTNSTTTQELTLESLQKGVEAVRAKSHYGTPVLSTVVQLRAIIATQKDELIRLAQENVRLADELEQYTDLDHRLDKMAAANPTESPSEADRLRSILEHRDDEITRLRERLEPGRRVADRLVVGRNVDQWYNEACRREQLIGLLQEKLGKLEGELADLTSARRREHQGMTALADLPDYKPKRGVTVVADGEGWDDY